ncbi:MAG: class I SAM-dependent methyltransferase [Tindallia sp. MSAO_Bac2]|nr:MAG: class I SAM-dependent methyltransferase [Tindallia sp. MSAO_Bac2]
MSEENLQYWIEHLEQDLDMEICEAFWDNRAKEFSQRSEKRHDKAERLIEKLQSKGAVTKDSRILDIGCGPGTHTVPLAKRSKEVYALDLSACMLRELERKANRLDIKNIKILKENWEEINLKNRGWNQHFDLVFASMSPAIHSWETLKKMMAASRGYCYLSAFIYRKDLIGDEIQNTVFEEENPGPARDTTKKNHHKIECVENILRLHAIDYEKEVSHRDWKMEMTLEEAYMHYVQKAGIKRQISNDERQKIREILLGKLDKEKIVECTEASVGEIIWKNSKSW